MGELAKLPNIGPALESKLLQAGISSADELVSLGSEAAFVRLRLKDPQACLSTLYALEGAVAGVRWHNLPQNRKDALRTFYHLP